MVTITIPCPGVCTPWATADDAIAPCNTGFDNTLLNTCYMAASNILFELSGRQYPGVCQDTVRPVLPTAAGDQGRPIGAPFIGPYQYWPGSGSARGFWMGGGNGLDATYPEITLGVYPLVGIERILIDGVSLPETDPTTGARNWRIYDNRWLMRMADPATGINPGWPARQRMDLDDDQEGTWSVTPLYGTPPPPEGKLAAQRLGCELAMAISPESTGECQLPQRVTHVTRQGVDMVVLDPMAFLDEGKTGLYEVDLFLESANPFGIRRPSAVWSPDIPRQTRTPR